jgi:hypothetical protein
LKAGLETRKATQLGVRMGEALMQKGGKMSEADVAGAKSTNKEEKARASCMCSVRE